MTFNDFTKPTYLFQDILSSQFDRRPYSFWWGYQAYTCIVYNRNASTGGLVVVTPVFDPKVSDPNPVAQY